MTDELDKAGLEAAARAVSGGGSLRDAIRAYLSVADGWRPRVKPLEWQPSALLEGTWLVVAMAHTPFGAYRVAKDDDTSFVVWPPDEDADDIRCTDKEAAKDAAQADYEARILSALVVLPSPPKEG